MGATGRNYDDDWPGWADKERKEEDDPSEGDSGKKKKKDDDEPEDDSPNRSGHHFGCCFKCRNEIADLCATIESWQWIEGWTTSRAWSRETTTSLSAT